MNKTENVKLVAGDPLSQKDWAQMKITLMGNIVSGWLSREHAAMPVSVRQRAEFAKAAAKLADTMLTRVLIQTEPSDED